MIIDLENRAIKNGINEKKLVRTEVKVLYKDREEQEISSDLITFILKFEPAEEKDEEIVEETIATEQSTVAE